MSASLPTSDNAAEYFEYLRLANPPTLRVWVAEEPAEFCGAVEDAVECALQQMEGMARQYSALCELGLSGTLALLLQAAGLDAASEPYHNGHVDVLVRQPAKRHFVMLGECKIYRGYKHHLEGCTQIMKRYASGREARTFSLDFFQQPEMYAKLIELREGFDANRPLDEDGGPEDHRIKGAFLTRHKHFTATIVEILHLGCNVFHPEAPPP